MTDPTKLAFHAHALKSMSLNLGAKRIVELSQKLEELGRAGNVSDAPALLKDLEAASPKPALNCFPCASSDVLPVRGQRSEVRSAALRPPGLLSSTQPIKRFLLHRLEFPWSLRIEAWSFPFPSSLR